MPPRRRPLDTVLHIDDAGFVRVPESVCYPTLTDLRGWPSWWRSTVVTGGGRDDGGDQVVVRTGVRPRGLRLDLVAGGWRHDAGFTLEVDGDVRGSWEVWLEPLPVGTVVHHVVAGRVRRAADARALRTWLRHGLWDLKDLLEERARRAMVGDAAADGEGGRPSTRGPVS